MADKDYGVPVLVKVEGKGGEHFINLNQVRMISLINQDGEKGLLLSFSENHSISITGGGALDLLEEIRKNCQIGMGGAININVNRT